MSIESYPKMLVWFRGLDESARDVVLTALRDSINHWAIDLRPELFPNFEKNPTAENCALCRRFTGKNEVRTGGSMACGHCPVWHAGTQSSADRGCVANSIYGEAWKAWTRGRNSVDKATLTETGRLFTEARDILIKQMEAAFRDLDPIDDQIFEAERLAEEQKNMKEEKSPGFTTNPSVRFRFYPAVGPSNAFWRYDQERDVLLMYGRDGLEMDRVEKARKAWEFRDVTSREELNVTEAIRLFKFPIYVKATCTCHPERAFYKYDRAEGAPTCFLKERDENGNAQSTPIFGSLLSDLFIYRDLDKIWGVPVADSVEALKSVDPIKAAAPAPAPAPKAGEVRFYEAQGNEYLAFWRDDPKAGKFQLIRTDGMVEREELSSSTINSLYRKRKRLSVEEAASRLTYPLYIVARDGGILEDAVAFYKATSPTESLLCVRTERLTDKAESPYTYLACFDMTAVLMERAGYYEVISREAALARIKPRKATTTTTESKPLTIRGWTSVFEAIKAAPGEKINCRNKDGIAGRLVLGGPDGNLVAFAPDWDVSFIRDLTDACGNPLVRAVETRDSAQDL